LASVAVQLTVVTPTGKVSFECWLHTTVTGNRSVAVGSPNATTAPALDVASTGAGADGRLRTGGVVSTTVTVNVNGVRTDEASGAWHDTVVDPSAKVVPLDTSQFSASLPASGYETEAPAAEVASAVISV
jgi:hypothetical protein